MPIESGPNAERKVRSSLLFLLVAIFAVWYGYDGWFGYPKNNVRDFLKTLPTDQRAGTENLKVNEAVNEKNIPKIETVKIRIDDNPESAIGAVLGGPPSLKTPDAWYYIGPAHIVKFALRDGRPADVSLPKTPHSATDIRWQKNYAYGLTVLAGIALIYVIRVRMAKARLDDAGLTLGSGPTIGWDAMKSLDSTHFRKKGWVVLYHGDPETPAKIDEYHYARFDDIIDAICARKGFDNPLTKLSATTDDTEADSADDVAKTDQA